MSLRLYELAELVGGTVVGDEQVEIQGTATLRDAVSGQVTLAEDSQHLKQLTACEASAAIVSGDANEGDLPDGVSLIRVADPRQAFAAIVRAFCPARPNVAPGIHPTATVSPTAEIAAGVSVGPNCFVGEDVRIGEGCVLHSGVSVMAGSQLAADVTIFPNAVLYENTLIGPRCIIHANAVLGAYGFGYASDQNGHTLSAQLGRVVLEADVEIGAGTTIDRGTYGATTIGEGTKIDNLVMIGHNCRIGRHNMLCAQVGVAGSCTTGDFVVMAGQVGMRDHIEIGDQIQIGGKSGVAESLSQPGQYLGVPAQPIREEIQCMMALQKLPALRKQLRALEKAVKSMQAAHEPTSGCDEESAAA